MAGHKTLRAALGLIAATLTISTASLHAQTRADCVLLESPRPVRVRALSPTLQDALQQGIRRSALLSSLVERIDRSDGLVYLMPGAIDFPNAGRLLGGLSHRIVRGPDYRLLRIAIWPQPGDQMIATIAHELRHAVEVLDAPETVDQLSAERLYDRIGVRRRATVYETEAAERAGERVSSELARCRL